MDESLMIERFDQLVNDGIAFYDADQKIIEQQEAGLKFSFIVTSAFLKKPTFQSGSHGKEADNSSELQPGSDINTVGFEVGTVGDGDSHIVAVNKYSFGRPHVILLSSDAYRRQYEPLDLSDFDAACKTLSTVGDDYVAIYNCGKDGGCSRLHKHMQMMPMPTTGFAAFLDSSDELEAPVPFEWYHERFDAAKPLLADDILIAYNSLLRKATKAYEASGGRIHDENPNAACPHNVILSKRWIVVLPRRQAAINKEAGANALGMLGVIAVATEAEIDKWRKLGLVESLKILGVPR